MRLQVSPPERLCLSLSWRALDSGGARGGIQHLPPRDPPESNACMLNLCRRHFKVAPTYSRDAWNKGGGNLF